MKPPQSKGTEWPFWKSEWLLCSLGLKASAFSQGLLLAGHDANVPGMWGRWGAGGGGWGGGRRQGGGEEEGEGSGGRGMRLVPLFLSPLSKPIGAERDPKAERFRPALTAHTSPLLPQHPHLSKLPPTLLDAWDRAQGVSWTSFHLTLRILSITRSAATCQAELTSTLLSTSSLPPWSSLQQAPLGSDQGLLMLCLHFSSPPVHPAQGTHNGLLKVSHIL